MREELEELRRQHSSPIRVQKMARAPETFASMDTLWSSVEAEIGMDPHPVIAALPTAPRFARAVTTAVDKQKSEYLAVPAMRPSPSLQRLRDENAALERSLAQVTSSIASLSKEQDLFQQRSLQISQQLHSVTSKGPALVAWDVLEGVAPSFDS